MKKTALRILLFSLILGVGLGLGCCKKPDKTTTNNNGTLVLKFHITGGGQPFALNKAILNTTGQRYYFNIFTFYASNVTLTGNDSQLLSSILLVDTYPGDISNNPAQVDTIFTFNVPAGSYSGLKFGIGPDAQQNQQGGGSYAYSNYPANSPLGDYYAQSGNQLYWSPSLGYLFFLAQGYFDSSANNAGSINQQFAYHCGTDTFFSTKTIASTIQITAGATTTFTINLETNDIFNAPNPINLKIPANDGTHTYDNAPLAKELLQNLNAALKTN